MPRAAADTRTSRSAERFAMDRPVARRNTRHRTECRRYTITVLPYPVLRRTNSGITALQQAVRNVKSLAEDRFSSSLRLFGLATAAQNAYSSLAQGHGVLAFNAHARRKSTAEAGLDQVDNRDEREPSGFGVASVSRIGV